MASAIEYSKVNSLSHPKNDINRKFPSSSNCRSGVADSPIRRKYLISFNRFATSPPPILCASSAISNNLAFGIDLIPKNWLVE